MSTTAFCVDNTLGNSLAVEVGQEINQVEVLQQERAILASSLGLIWVRDGGAIAGVECQ